MVLMHDRDGGFQGGFGFYRAGSGRGLSQKPYCLVAGASLSSNSMATLLEVLHALDKVQPRLD